MNETIRVALVDDHLVVTRGLRLFLESFPDLEVVAAVSRGEDILAHADAWKPQVVIMDLMLPGGLDGIEVTRRLVKAHPEIRVVALTASVDDARLVGVLRAGASGYLRKDTNPELLVDAIRTVARGGTFIDPSVAGDALLAESRATDLSPRELEVLRQLASGLTNREIADRLFVGEETVKTHVARILMKLGLRHRTQLVAYALKQGLVRLEEL